MNPKDQNNQQQIDNQQNKKITLDYFDDYKSKKELIQKWLDYLPTIGLATDDVDNWKKFIDVNSYTLYLEIKYFDLEKTNPFFMFLYEFIKTNKSISPLINLYDQLHNLVARDVINSKQLAFTCPQNEQIQILLNNSLYKNNSADYVYLIKCYNWLLDITIDRDIKNKYVVGIFKDNDRNSTELSTDKLLLIKTIFFTDALIKLMTSNKTADDENRFLDQLEIAESKSLIADPLINCDTIEQNIKWLNENIQESSTDIYGRTQQSDSVGNEQTNNNKNSIYLSTNQKQALKQKLQPQLDQLTKNLAQNTGINLKASDLAKLINQIFN